MDIEEIKTQYNDKLNELCNGYYTKIDNKLINNYPEIKKTGKTKIAEGDFQVHGINDRHREHKEDIILSIQEHYKNNWEVTHSSNYLMFIYKKGSSPISQVVSEVEEVVVEEVKEIENRFELLDL